MYVEHQPVVGQQFLERKVFNPEGDKGLVVPPQKERFVCPPLFGRPKGR